jgi:hypothetical protein
MAKMFYNLEEAQAKLKMNRDEVKLLVEQGTLRKFYDGSKEMFKVDDVDKLAAAGAMHDSEIHLAPEDTSEHMGLSGGDSGPGMGLAPVDREDEVGIEPLGSGSAAGLSADDTDVKPKPGKDAGSASGSLGLIPLSDSSDQVKIDDTSESEAAKDDTVLTSHGGINVMDDSDGDKELVADPLAQTQIAPELADQVQLDSGSSGSGLLDLTREADDTSLGAELLEEIYPGTDQEGAIETQVPSTMGMMGGESSSIISMESQAEPLVSYAKAVEVYDPTSTVFGLALVVPLLYLFYLACAAAAGAMGMQPRLMAQLSQYNLWVCVGGLVVTFGIMGAGLLVSQKSSGPAKPKAPKAPKTPKAPKAPKKPKPEKPKKPEKQDKKKK